MIIRAAVAMYRVLCWIQVTENTTASRSRIAKPVATMKRGQAVGTTRRSKMEANVIKAHIAEAWLDASASWKDEYASSYKTAVIDELESALDNLQKTSGQLGESIDTVLSSLREFD
jgi:hypothetical protein